MILTIHYHGLLLAYLSPDTVTGEATTADGTRNFLSFNAPGMGRFQMLNLGVLGYRLELRFWVLIAIIVSLTLTITLITTLTMI